MQPYSENEPSIGQRTDSSPHLNIVVAGELFQSLEGWGKKEITGSKNLPQTSKACFAYTY